MSAIDLDDAVPALGALAGGLTRSIGPAFLATGLFLTALAVKWGPIRGARLRLLPDRIAAQLPRFRSKLGAHARFTKAGRHG